MEVVVVVLVGLTDDEMLKAEKLSFFSYFA